MKCAVMRGLVSSTPEINPVAATFFWGSRADPQFPLIAKGQLYGNVDKTEDREA